MARLSDGLGRGLRRQREPSDAPTVNRDERAAERDAAAAPPPRFFTRYGSLLPARPRRTVVILADDHLRGDLVPYLQQYVDDDVRVISYNDSPEWHLERYGAVHRPADNLDEINWLLRFAGPVDVLHDFRSLPEEDVERTWVRLFFHLRAGGVYVIRRGPLAAGRLGKRLMRIAAVAGTDVRQAQDLPAADMELARSTGEVLVGTDFIVIGKRGKHFLKVREKDANRLLPARSERLRTRVLATLPAGSFTSRARVHSHEAAVPIGGLEDKISYPQLHLRHYQGKIGLVSNALLFSESSVLPDSFRHHLESNPQNPRLVSINADFARIPRHLLPQRTLEGSYYQLDSENSGHYGHLVTEVISRLWGWRTAKEQVPDLKAVFRIRYPNERDPALERRIFNAFGIDDADIVWLDEPAWLRSVVAATPMWHNQLPHYVHPDIAEIWRTISDSVMDEKAPAYRRLFVSRKETTGNRACANAREVEEFFVGNGFHVIYPEELDLSQQAGVFNNAEVIAGFGGSAMFNLLYRRQPGTVILLNHEAYTARNEHLFTVVLGGDIHYFWSAPDVAHPPEGWSEKAYYSSWSFDFDRNGRPLQELLDRLP